MMSLIFVLQVPFVYSEEEEEGLDLDGVPVPEMETEEIPPVLSEEPTDEETQETMEDNEVHHNDVDDDSTVDVDNDSSSSTTASNNNNNSKNDHHQQQQHHGETHCAWGTACHPDSDQERAGNAGTIPQQQQAEPEHQQQHASAEAPPKTTQTMDEPIAASHTATTNTRSAEKKNASGSTEQKKIPFVPHHHNTAAAAAAAAPPEGFTITARVYTNPNDKLAHFTDDQEGSHIALPYWECGATGSTTSPLPVKHAYFRHALAGAQPQVWSGTEYGPHPQLVIALKHMELILNSGETKEMRPGDVVLFEDVVSGGHKFKSYHHNSGGGGAAANNVAAGDVSYLVVTLPQHYHHVGRDRMSLRKAATEKKVSPCNNAVNNNNNNDKTEQEQQPAGGAFMSKGRRGFTGTDNTTGGDVAPLRESKIRKLVLGALGVSFSTLVADFLGKVAPLWLAVGIGGTCFVVGGTACVVQGGDYVWTEIEMWHERKRLEHPDVMSSSGSALSEDEDEEEVLEAPAIMS